MSDGQAPRATYHIELRQFPHNFCHFNLSERELYDTIVGPWAREQWIELGERKWSPHQAKLTVLEGTHLALDQLTMGRGWRNAQRTSRDVTDRVLAAARARDQAAVGPVRPAGVQGGPVAAQGDSGAPAVAPARAPDEALLADSLGLELLTQLASGIISLHHAWELAAARHPQRTAAQSLLLAERAVTALLESELIVLLRRDAAEDVQRPIPEVEIPEVVHAVPSWAGEIVCVARR